jgi:acyl-ACP thioesterase
MSFHSVIEKVQSFNVDVNKKLKLGSLLEFMQQAAYEHAEILNVGYSHLNVTKQVWVLSRVIIEVNKYPVWGDKISICTWPKGLKGLFALRDFEIKNENDETIINATSAWLIIDLDTRRPVRNIEKIKMVETHSKNGVEEFPDKLDKVESSKSKMFSADYSAIDLNEHVNNAQYVNWIADCLPEKAYRHNSIKKLQVNFNSEMRWGDELELSFVNNEGREYLFYGYNKTKNNNTFQAKLLLSVNT